MLMLALRLKILEVHISRPKGNLKSWFYSHLIYIFTNVQSFSVSESVPCLPHCKKRLACFPSPGGMSLTNLSLVGNNLTIPGQGVWFLTSWLGTGNSLTFFYSTSGCRSGLNRLTQHDTLHLTKEISYNLMIMMKE